MFEEPESMENLAYFTNRSLGEAGEGNVTCWVERKECPKCKAALMGKPIDPKTKRPKTRATEYVCPECGYSVPKKEYEESLTAKANYKCPECGKEDSQEIPFKRKKVEGVETLRFNCSECGCNLDVTKKMKEKKKKK